MTNKRFVSLLAIMFLLFTAVFANTGCGGGSNSPIAGNQTQPDDSNPSPETNPSPEPTPTPGNSFTVTFDSNGGTEIASQTVENGKYANMPNIPKKENNLFIGWYTAEDNRFSFKFNFDTPISRDIILHAKWYDKKDTTDTDGDGLSDSLELAFGTDPLNPDTDNDGLTDFNEINWLNYNPLVQDTNNNGILDGDEDYDGDGLTNIREQELKTNLILSDTDLDGLSDYDEVTTYKTDPLNSDTDDDKVDDGTEVAIGSNPLIAETTFTTKLGSSFTEENSKAIDINVEMASSAENAGSLSIQAVNLIGHPLISIATPGYISNAAYEIVTNNSNDIESATLTFTLGSDYQETESFKPRIYYLNEEKGIIEKVEGQTVSGNKVSALLKHFSTYALLNSIVFDSHLESLQEFAKLSATADITTDSNNDGLSDYYTEAILNGNILLQDGTPYLMCIPETSKDLADWDHDGLLNGEEIYVTTVNGITYVKMKSDPLLVDTDGDGYSDYDEVKKWQTSPTKITRPLPGIETSTTLKDIELNDMFPEKYVEFSESALDPLQLGVFLTENEKFEYPKKLLMNYFSEYATGEILSKDAEVAARQVQRQYWIDGLHFAGSMLLFAKTTTDIYSNLIGGKYSESFKNESEREGLRTQLEKANKLGKITEELIANGINVDLQALYYHDLGIANALDKPSAVREALKEIYTTKSDFEDLRGEINNEQLHLVDDLLQDLSILATTIDQSISVIDKFNKIDITPKNKLAQKILNFKDANNMGISVGFTVILDAIDMVSSLYETAYCYGQIEANYAEYYKILNILPYIIYTSSNLSHIQKAAEDLYLIFHNGSPDWNELNNQLYNVMQKQIEASTLKMIIDGAIAAASVPWPAVGAIKFVWDFVKSEFIDSYVDALSEAQVYYAICRGSKSQLSGITELGSYYFSFSKDDKNDVINYSRALAQARILGLNGVADYIINGNVLKQLKNNFNLFGGYETEKEIYRQIIGRVYDFVNSCAIDVSPKLPGYDSEYNRKIKNPDTPTTTPVAGDITIDAAHFPDAVFRTYVKDNFDTDNNNILSATEIAKVTKIDVINKDISSLSGIEYFTALTHLDCYHNSIRFESIRLTNLDVSKNTALTHLDCSGNLLTTLDVSKNTALKYLNCQYTQLTTLDVSQNTSLEWLVCHQNKLTTLDVTKNVSLQILQCNRNQLTTLDVSKNTVLSELDCSDNQLTTLDLSNCPKLNSKNVTCDDDVTIIWYSSINPSPVVDVPIDEEHFPDEYFRDFYMYKFDSNHDGILSQAEIKNAKELDVSVSSLSLKGIEYLTSLVSLDCSEAELKELDVSKNIALEWLNCSQNRLSTLDVSKNTMLKLLNCSDNSLENLNLSGCTNIQYLNCSENDLENLNLSDCAALRELDCEDNLLTTLDVSGKTDLQKLYYFSSRSELQTLNASGCRALKTLDYSYGTLTELDVSDCTALQELDCDDNNLYILNVKGCVSLETLSCMANGLMDLDVSSCTVLKKLYCSDNLLETLDVTQNTVLEVLYCPDNKLTKIDVSNCSKNIKVDCDKDVTVIYTSTTSNVAAKTFTSENRTAYQNGNEIIIASLPSFTAEHTGEYSFDVSLDKTASVGSTLTFKNSSENLLGVFTDENGEEITMPATTSLDRVKVSANFVAGKTYSPVIVASSEAENSSNGSGGCNSALYGLLSLAFVVMKKRS